MDYTQKITEFRAQKSKLMADAEKAAAEGRIEDMTKIADNMTKINDSIAAMERILDESRKHAEPAGYDGALHDDGKGEGPKAKQGEDCKPFASLGEQLMSWPSPCRRSRRSLRTSRIKCLRSLRPWSSMRKRLPFGHSDLWTRGSSWTASRPTRRSRRTAMEISKDIS